MPIQQMHKFVIGIQARVGSSRLPGKVMYKLGDSNMNSMEMMVKRIRANITLANIPLYLLTSIKPEDCVIEYNSDQMGLCCLRGKEKDVLSRYSILAKKSSAENIIRLTADCPFICPEEIVRVMKMHEEEDADYTTNTFEGSTTPDGFDVEIIKAKSIILSDQIAIMPSEREHVTFHIAKSNLFSTVKTPMSNTNSKARLTLDTSEDYLLISKIIEKLKRRYNASAAEILQIYEDNKEIQSINSHLSKNHGWESALEADKIYEQNN